MKRKISLISLLMVFGLCTGCNTHGDAYSPNSGVKLEDAQQKKDMQFDSPLPNGSANMPPSEMSASPNGQSQGSSPDF